MVNDIFNDFTEFSDEELNIPTVYNYNINELNIDIEAELCRRSLSYFTKKFFPVVDQAKYMHNTHIDLVCDYLQVIIERVIHSKRKKAKFKYKDKDKQCAFHYNILNRQQRRLVKNKLAISLPPGHMKSLLVSVMLQAWAWLTDPTLGTLNISANDMLITRDAARTKLIITNNLYQAICDNLKLSSDQNTKTWYKNNKFGESIGLGVGATVTGLRADILKLDDLISAVNVHSDVERENVNQSYIQQLSNRVNNQKKRFTIIIMQRLHVHDLIGMLQKMNKLNKDFTFLTLQSIMDRDLLKSVGLRRSIGDNRVDGELLFEKYMDKKALRIELNKGEAYFNAQCQQCPIETEGLLFKRCYFLSANIDINDLHLIQVWDTAEKTKPTNDCTVGLVLGLDYATRNIYIVDVIKVRYSFEGITGLMWDWSLKYPSTTSNIYVEDTSSGTSILSSYRDKFPSLVITGITPRGSKWVRVTSIINYFVDGKVYLINKLKNESTNNPYKDKGAMLKSELIIKDCLKFKDQGVDDDLPDCLTHGIKILSQQSNCLIGVTPWKRL